MKIISKKQLAAVVAFLVVCFVGDRVGGFAMGRLFMSTHFRYSDLYAGNLSSDVLFLGNSRGVHMFHRPPLQQVSGKRVANLSFNALPATMIPIVLEDYLKNQNSPSELFIEVTCIGRVNEPGSLSRFTVLADRSEGFNQLLAKHRPKHYWASQISHLYRYNSELLIRSLFFLRKSDQDWIMESEVDAAWEETLPPEMIRRFERSEADLESLKEAISIAERNDVDVKLILAPYLPGYFALTDSCSEWLNWIETETGTKVLDYSLAIEDSSCFADPIHLNPKGAEVLARLLQRNGDF